MISSTLYAQGRASGTRSALAILCVCLSFGAGQRLQAVGDEPPTGAPHATVARQALQIELERSAVAVPAALEPILLEVEAYNGDWRLLTVVAPGTSVAAGDMIARCDARALEDQLQEAEDQLAATDTEHGILVDRENLARATREVERELAQRALERTRAALVDWEEKEVAFEQRQAELSDQGAVHSLTDMEDELGQLVRMYEADELTDETEEIVLMRQRRSIAHAREQLALARARRAYRQEQELARQRAERGDGLVRQEQDYERLVLDHRLAERTAEMRLEQSQQGLLRAHRQIERLRRDAERMVLRAPVAGVLLHGGPHEIGPGRAAGTLRAGDRLTPHGRPFCIATAEHLTLELEVPESFALARSGPMPVTVYLPGTGSRTVDGQLRVEPLPLARSATGAENLYTGRIATETPLTGLAPGTRLTVRAAVTVHPEGLVVPAAALHGSTEAHVVYAAQTDGTNYRRVPVRAVARAGGMVLIEGELAAGEQVLLSPPEA